jgi:hypothetical protein
MTGGGWLDLTGRIALDPYQRKARQKRIRPLGLLDGVQGLKPGIKPMRHVWRRALIQAVFADRTLLLESERCAIRSWVETCDMTFGKDPRTYDLAARILNEEIEHEVWFIELLAHERDGKSVPSGHFRRGEPGHRKGPLCLLQGRAAQRSAATGSHACSAECAFDPPLRTRIRTQVELSSPPPSLAASISVSQATDSEGNCKRMLRISSSST